MQKEIFQELEKGKLPTTSFLLLQLDTKDYSGQVDFLFDYTSYFYLDVEEEEGNCWHLCLEGYGDFFLIKSFTTPEDMNKTLETLKSVDYVSDELIEDLGFSLE